MFHCSFVSIISLYHTTLGAMERARRQEQIASELVRSTPLAVASVVPNDKFQAAPIATKAEAEVMFIKFVEERAKFEPLPTESVVYSDDPINAMMGFRFGYAQETLPLLKA